MFYFRLGVNGGQGDNMVITGFAPPGSTSVPATGPWWLVAVIAGVALIGLLVLRRRRARA